MQFSLEAAIFYPCIRGIRGRALSALAGAEQDPGALHIRNLKWNSVARENSVGYPTDPPLSRKFVVQSALCAHNAHQRRKTRNFAACGFSVNHVFLGGAYDVGFGRSQSALGGFLIASGDRFFHNSHECAHPAAPKLINRRAPGGGANRLFCRFYGGHADVPNRAPALSCPV